MQSNDEYAKQFSDTSCARVTDPLNGILLTLAELCTYAYF